MEATGDGPVEATGDGPVVTLAEKHDLSRPLRELNLAQADAYRGSIVDIPVLPLPKPAPNPFAPEQINRISAQSLDGVTVSMPAPLIQWQGLSNLNNVLPPDTNGDVGLNHYVQWVNLSLAVWDKQGHLLVGPLPGNAIWSGFGGSCETYNSGDPIVLYDSLADRWFISQFALPGAPVGYYQCVAVSQTADPTGSWYRYAYRWSTNLMNDYGKFGVWTDGYYLSVNQFNEGKVWAGAGVAVLERDRMLQGLSARMITFDLFQANPNFGGLLPADLDGQRAPPTGAPVPFVEWDDAWDGNSPDMLRVWNFHVDWNQPSLSTFGNQLQPNRVIPTANVNPHNQSGSMWITQPNTTQKLDALNDRLMYRLQYRNFGVYRYWYATIRWMRTEIIMPASTGLSCAPRVRIPGPSFSRGSSPQTPITAGWARSRWMGQGIWRWVTAFRVTAAFHPSPTGRGRRAAGDDAAG